MTHFCFFAGKFEHGVIFSGSKQKRDRHQFFEHLNVIKRFELGASFKGRFAEHMQKMVSGLLNLAQEVESTKSYDMTLQQRNIMKHGNLYPLGN